MQATITVSRLYGSQDDIQVSGAASQTASQDVPNGKVTAIAGADFSTAVLSVIIPAGTVSGDLVIPLSQNSQENQLKVFTFTLTSVMRLPTQGLLYNVAPSQYDHY